MDSVLNGIKEIFQFFFFFSFTEYKCSFALLFFEIIQNSCSVKIYLVILDIYLFTSSLQTIFGQSSIRLQPPDIFFQSDFDSAVSRMATADNRELIHCVYTADVNALKPCYKLCSRIRKSEDWPRYREKILKILEMALDEEDKDIYLTSGKATEKQFQVYT